MHSTSLSNSRLTGKRYTERAPLVFIECEGSLFDTYRSYVEIAYIPAFLSRFACLAPESVCRELWINVALRSRYRGAEPLRMLAAVLRLLNRIHAPSVRRSVVAAAIEARLSILPPGMWRYDLDFRMDPVLKPALDWLKESEFLISSMPPPAVFMWAKKALDKMCECTTLACISQQAEAEILSLWNESGLASTGAVVSGKEQGDMGTCLHRAIQSGFEVNDITVIGSSMAAMSVAKSFEARFFPILPDDESNSWASIFENSCNGAVNACIKCNLWRNHQDSVTLSRLWGKRPIHWPVREVQSPEC